ncbi:proton-conducting transporter membrane subunit [Paracoccus marcusii]|uniref:proton-conducting transporter transmembrane domain-containing protein n=1 Tax=Paracoccus marcusii TaxID=59779 RepID=UPI002ED4C3EF|nr:proton-conducting transporter membrane subunit [Paracoccus marcusii]
MRGRPGIGRAALLSLFQFLLVGLNGAFLTGDLFNLFVFFEVLLAASYGLLLHGSGQVRVRAGLHYIAINLAASLLLLLGISLIYGVTGTLNMAHLASMMPDIDAANRPLLQMGLTLMGWPSWSRRASGRCPSGCPTPTWPPPRRWARCSRSRPRWASMRFCA